MLELFMRPKIQTRLKIVIDEYNLERRKAGLQAKKVSEIAEEIHVAASTLNAMNTNRHELVSLRVLAALCAYFNRPPGDFLQFTPGDDAPEPEPKPKRRRASGQQAELASRAGQ